MNTIAQSQPLTEAEEQRLSDTAARLPGNGRAILKIPDLNNAETLCDFLLALKVNTNRPENVKAVPYPAQISVDWLEVPDPTGKAMSRSPVFARVPNFAKTLAGLLAGEFTVPADSLDELRKIQADIDESLAEMNNWTHQKADAFFAGQSAELARKCSSGKLDDVIMRARDEIRHDYKKKRDAIDLRIKPLTERARALAAPIIQDAMTAVVSRMAYLEVTERSTATEHGIPWMPSHLWKCAASVVMQLNNPRLHQEINPRSMLAGVAEL